MSGKPRGKGFCASEEKHMVDCIRLIKPCNITQWERVLTLHNTEFAEKDQDITSLRRKFAAMHCKHPGTGNPNIPDVIQDAKIAWYEIKQKAECITGNDSDDNNEYLGEDISNYLKKTKTESVAMKVEDAIALD
eukprot:9202109-Ditylum_brightwellii.AAC.1